MFVWVERIVDYLYGRNRCDWCGELIEGELCECEGGELIVIDDSDISDQLS